MHDRISKGNGIINKIFSIIDTLCFGPYLFEIAVLLRNSMLINGVLNNAEIWYNLLSSEIKLLESLDKIFFSCLFHVPGTTPAVSFYLELGVLPISVVIKARRIVYLQSILQRREGSMLLSFFLVQLRNPSKGDWTETVLEDLKDFQIDFSIDFFKNTSKEKMKKLVKQKATEFSFGKLMEKKNRYSKLKDLTYSSSQLQAYLKDGKTSVEEKINAFKFRTKMALFG